MEHILETVDLVKYYGEGESLVKAVDHVSLQIKRGHFTAVVGRSGSGKSTLLHLLGGLDLPDAGKVFLEGEEIYGFKKNDLVKLRRRKIGFIFQDYNLIPSLNVWENVVLPVGLDERRAEKEQVEKLLEKIGMADKKYAMPNTLSGGQKQRAAIARALISEPVVILADEPTGNLDSHTGFEVIQLLKSCVSEMGQTLVMITHDETIAQMADDVFVMKDGRAVERI